MLLSVFSLLSIFIKKACLILSLFFCIRRWSCGFFSFLFLIWCIKQIAFCMLNHLGIPGINSTWSLVYNPFKMLLDSVCCYFIEEFYSYISKALFFFFCIFLILSIWLWINVTLLLNLLCYQTEDN